MTAKKSASNMVTGAVALPVMNLAMDFICYPLIYMCCTTYKLNHVCELYIPNRGDENLFADWSVE